jgi:hypothetical protein
MKRRQRELSGPDTRLARPGIAPIRDPSRTFMEVSGLYPRQYANWGKQGRIERTRISGFRAFADFQYNRDQRKGPVPASQRTPEPSSIQGVTPHSGTDIDGTRGDPSRPPPYPAPSKHQSGRLSKAKYLAGLDRLDLETAFGIGLQLAITLVVIDEDSHSADVLHSLGSLLVDLDVGATDAPAEWWGRRQHQEESERVRGV